MTDTNERDYGEPPDGFILSAEHQQQWVESTYWARACELILKRVHDPNPGSLLDLVDRVYELEKVSVWTRSYLRAAAEHLSLWSDYVAPQVIAPGAVSRIRARSYLLLARGALESGSHALWLVKAISKDQCIERFAHLMRSDFEFHRKALIAGGLDTSLLDSRISHLKSRCEELSLPVPPKKSPSYVQLVRDAATALHEDKDHWAYLWNAASGAGHGQNWFGIEGFGLLAKEEYEPGHYHIVSIPYPSFVTDTIGAACTVLRHGTESWLMMGGHNPDLVQLATREVFDQMPKKGKATG